MKYANMNREMGTKWFVFYTKWRPWISCISIVATIGNFVQQIEIYKTYWWLSLSLVVALVQTALLFAVMVKAEGDYRRFVPFVKKVLFFETMAIAYNQGVQSYINSSFNIAEALFVSGVVLLLLFLLWYRLNIKYFEKRVIPDKIAVEGEHFEEKKKTIINDTEAHFKEQSNDTSEMRFSLSPEGEIPRTYGNYNVYGSDMMLDSVGISHEEQAVTTTIDPQEKSPQILTPATKRRTRYCSRCGNLVDPDTKKCTGCGKQYFRGIRFTKFSITVIALVSVVAVVSALCIVQHSDIQALKDEIDTKQTTINRLISDSNDNWDRLDFYDNAVVVIGDDGTEMYHKYGCSKLDISNGYWILNEEAADYDGYKRCSRCND